MEINKITPYAPFYKYKEQEKPAEQALPEQQKYMTSSLPSQGYNDHLVSISFTGLRVDKGLERFFEVNQDRMPKTVRAFVEGLKDKMEFSPLEAQRKAYELLGISDSISDIKGVYPEETLFNELIDPLQSNARRGIIQCIRENDELLKLSGEGPLKDNENFTVYLVKKIFLEDKTIDEINKDLEKDLNVDFKADFKFKNPKSQYIYPSTLTALGIKTPQFEYRQSLRYTREGYSDLVGDRISAFWNSLSDADRLSHSKKSVLNFENWWASLTPKQKLDMLAEQDAELEMLKQFKKFKKAEAKQTSTTTATATEDAPVNKPRKHTKVGSTTLAKDELFKKWATNHLKIYEAGLSEADKDSLHIRRVFKLASRWKEMTPTERTDYISKMKSGSEPLRYTMIDAWNHSQDIIKDLSQHLRENQIYKPADILYSSKEFSQFQSRVMTEFWDSHPEYSEKLGINIINSREKIQDAISNGRFEELKRQILRDKNQRIKEIEKFKKTITSQVKPETVEVPIPTYMEEFKAAYLKVMSGQFKNLPDEYIQDYFRVIAEGYSEAHVKAWTRNLRGEPLLDDDITKLKQIAQTEPKEGQKVNRAIEGALANVLYECTGSPIVYKLSHSDLKVALHQLARGEDHIEIVSQKLRQQFTLPIKKRKIDKQKIATLYRSYKENIPGNNLDDIISNYFEAYLKPIRDNSKLAEYLQTYGKSIYIIFSDKSIYPKAVKQAMFEKFIHNMPQEVADEHYCSFLRHKDPFGREETVAKILQSKIKDSRFIPKTYNDMYMQEYAKIFRRTGEFSPYEIENAINTTRVMISDNVEFKLKTMALQKTLADLLYEATENKDVYNCTVENLLRIIEKVYRAKKFPVEYIINDKSQITVNNRINIANIQQNYVDYVNEIADWVNTDVKNGNATLEDLVLILNPYEETKELDDIIKHMISEYHLNLK